MAGGPAGGRDASDGVLVTPEWLRDRLEHTVVYDGSWYLPTMNRNIWAEHQQCRIQARGANDPAD